MLAAAEEAIPGFEAAGDDLGLAKAWAAIADYHYSRAQFAQQGEAFERSLHHARRAGDHAQAAHALARLSATFRWGPHHLDTAIARMESELSDDGIPPHARAVWSAFCGELETARGNVERGRELSRFARTLAEEIGDSIAAFWVWTASVEIELLAGGLAEAEALARENLERCERLGHGWPDIWRITIARVLLEQERIDEAEDVLTRVELLDKGDEAGVYVVQARLLARRGDLREAERKAREAVGVLRGDGLTDAQGRERIERSQRCSGSEAGRTRRPRRSGRRSCSRNNAAQLSLPRARGRCSPSWDDRNPLLHRRNSSRQNLLCPSPDETESRAGREHTCEPRRPTGADAANTAYRRALAGTNSKREHPARPRGSSPEASAGPRHPQTNR